MNGPPGPDRSAIAVLGAWVVALLALLFVQVRHPEPFLNDSVLHFGLLRALVSAPERGQSILDPWVPTWALGFPAFHYYQNLPHLIVAALWKASLGTLSLLRAFRVVEWLAVATFPLPIYVSVRWLGFGRSAAAGAGVLVLLTKTDYLHGLDLESYTWQGLGQFAQAVGAWVFPLAFAKAYATIRRGDGFPAAAWLVTIAFLAHLALGTMVFFGLGLLALLVPREIPRRIVRLVILGVVTGAAAAYVVVPILRDFDFYNLSGLVPSWKYHSVGHVVALTRFVRGELFDFGRPAVLTVLVATGFVWATVRSVLHARRKLEQPEAERALLAMLVLFFLLYFGRPTWGRLLDLIPLGRGFHWSRTLILVHLFGTMLAGVAAADLLSRLARRGRFGGAIAVLLAAGILALPVAERVSYLRRNGDLVRDAATKWSAERDDLEAALAFAAQDRLGRVYAGQGRPGARAAGWSGEFQVGWVPVYSWFPQREMDALGYLHHMWSLNADLHVAFDESKPVHYRVFNVRRVVAPPEVPTPPFEKELARFGRFRVLGVDGPGFVELVDAPYGVDVPKRNLARVQREWLEKLAPANVFPELHLVTDDADRTGAPLLDTYQVKFPAADLPPGPRGEVLDVQRTGDDFDAEVRADRTCHLVLKMSFHPGWRVTVDGEPAEALHLLPSFVGVAIPPGTHRVSFSWNPGRSKEWLALAGFALLAVFSIRSRRLRL